MVPSNDDFERRMANIYPVSSYPHPEPTEAGYFGFNNVGATKQPGEPNHAGNRGSASQFGLPGYQYRIIGSALQRSTSGSLGCLYRFLAGVSFTRDERGPGGEARTALSEVASMVGLPSISMLEPSTGSRLTRIRVYHDWRIRPRSDYEPRAPPSARRSRIKLHGHEDRAQKKVKGRTVGPHAFYSSPRRPSTFRCSSLAGAIQDLRRLGRLQATHVRAPHVQARRWTPPAMSIRLQPWPTSSSRPPGRNGSGAKMRTQFERLGAGAGAFA